MAFNERTLDPFSCKATSRAILDEQSDCLHEDMYITKICICTFFTRKFLDLRATALHNQSASQHPGAGQSKTFAVPPFSEFKQLTSTRGTCSGWQL